MADDLHAIADLVADAMDLSGTEISDVLDDAPFIQQMGFVPSSDGTNHKYVKKTQNPVVGFRAANAGRDFDSSIDSINTDALKLLDWSWAADKGVADAWRQGGAEAYIAREGIAHIAAAMATLETQVFNGTDAAGFSGFADLTTLDGLADSMVIGAGGSTALTSVYLVNLSESSGVVGVFKGDGPSIDVGTTVVQDMLDGSSKHFPSYYTPASSWFGLQIGGAMSVSRIANVDASSNSLTDDLIAQAIEQHPTGQKPTAIAMNRRSQRQLQDSRTATTPTGAPAPFPEQSFNIPIIVTDALGNAETAVT